MGCLYQWTPTSQLVRHFTVVPSRYTFLLGGRGASEILDLPHVLGTTSFGYGQRTPVRRWNCAPEFGIAGIEQDSCFAIECDTQQCTFAFKIVPRNQQALSIGRPAGTHQTVPSFYGNLSLLASGCGAEVDLSVVRTKDDNCSFRAIRGQVPIAIGIDLWWFCTLAVPHIEPERFRSIPFCDAV